MQLFDDAAATPMAEIEYTSGYDPIKAREENERKLARGRELRDNPEARERLRQTYQPEASQSTALTGTL